jgi:phosphomannomutase
MMDIDKSIFKAYDIRGVYPGQVNEQVAGAIARGLVLYLQKKTGKNNLTLILGRDVRESGESLMKAFLEALLKTGTNVINISMVSTDLFYYAVGSLDVDGGVTISASHNPREYNGFNISARGAVPIAGDSGLKEIYELAIGSDKVSWPETKAGRVEEKNITEDFLQFVSGFVNILEIKPLKIVADANFGLQTKILEQLVKKFNLPMEIVPLNSEPNGSFPKGHPNPLLPERRHELCDLVLSSGSDLGVAWDADGDRCFFVDERGEFMEGCFTTAVLAEYLLKVQKPGQKVIIDPRIIWASTQAVKSNGGEVIVCKPGMTVIAKRMKEEGALFAGENSSHFYFRENFYRDNGLIPLLIMLGIMSQTGKKLSELYQPYTSQYFISGEINFKVNNVQKILEEFEQIYKDGQVEHIDGLSVNFGTWRFNLRGSNTEPLIRLNVESTDKKLLEEKTKELSDKIKTF